MSNAAGRRAADAASRQPGCAAPSSGASGGSDWIADGTVTAGGYFLTPSIRALALLARPTPQVRGERRKAFLPAAFPRYVTR